MINTWSIGNHQVMKVTITNYSYIIPEVTITENPRPQILQATGTSWTLSRVLMFIYIFAAAPKRKTTAYFRY